MSEMLGNQYFLARNYKQAIPEFEECLKSDANQKLIQRKLIICYTQNNEFDKALLSFHDLVSKDIKLIIDADPIRDDCPCAELIREIKISGYNIFENKVILGILWLYCDIKTSLEYFLEAQKIKPNNLMISQISNIIKTYQKTNSLIMEKKQ